MMALTVRILPAFVGLIYAFLAQAQPAFDRPLPPDVQSLRFEVVQAIAHDPQAFTQGLLWYGRGANGRLYESTGLYGGRSSLRRLHPATGVVEVGLRLPENLFAEGLARVGDRLLQLTWKAGLAIEFRLDTMRPTGRQFHYSGEGWGLCFDGRELWMSDGSSSLAVRDPATFGVRRTIPVRIGKQAVERLNELECVGDSIFANIWQSDYIIRINKHTGRVDGLLDATGLFPQRNERHDVLNGIAYRPDSGSFFLTGKLWPKMFEVRITPEARPAKSSTPIVTR